MATLSESSALNVKYPPAISTGRLVTNHPVTNKRQRSLSVRMVVAWICLNTLQYKYRGFCCQEGPVELKAEIGRFAAENLNSFLND